MFMVWESLHIGQWGKMLPFLFYETFIMFILINILIYAIINTIKFTFMYYFLYKVSFIYYRHKFYGGGGGGYI